MTWENAVIGTAQLVFFAALVPAVRERVTPPAITSAMTAAGLYAMAAAFGSLGLGYSTLTTMCTALMWTILLLYRVLDVPQREG